MHKYAFSIHFAGTTYARLQAQRLNYESSRSVTPGEKFQVRVHTAQAGRTNRAQARVAREPRRRPLVRQQLWRSRAIDETPAKANQKATALST